MDGTWVKLMRSEEVMELLHNTNAFALLSVIAIRARRTNKFNRFGLTIGQALIGDYKRYGMTERSYRTAKDKLEKWGFVTFKGTNKGTIATLCDKRIYDINPETKDEQNDGTETDKGRVSDGQETTNKNVKNANNEKKVKKFIPPILQDVVDYAKSRNSSLDPKVFFEFFDVAGWADSRGTKVKNWKQKFISWESRNGRQASETGQRQSQNPATSGGGVDSGNSNGDFIR